MTKGVFHTTKWVSVRYSKQQEPSMGTVGSFFSNYTCIRHISFKKGYTCTQFLGGSLL